MCFRIQPTTSMLDFPKIMRSGSQLSHCRVFFLIFEPCTSGILDDVAYLWSGHQRHFIFVLFNEFQGATQPDCCGVQSNEYFLETNAQTRGAWLS